MRHRRLSAFCLLLTFISCVTDTFAQSKLLHKVDSLLILFQKTNTDTNYIVRPEGKLTLRLLNNLSGASVIAIQRGSGGSKRDFAHLRSDMKETIAASVNYRGVSLSLSVNPGHLFDWYHDLELNVNSYGNKMGMDFIFQSSRTFQGEVNSGKDSHYVLKGAVRQQTITADYYYAFNHRRFSYPAAFTQSFLQKRSSGSWMVGASYLDLHLTMDEMNNLTGIGIPSKLKARQFGIGAGYGYNIVASHRWLFHLSALPTIVIWKNMNLHDYEVQNSSQMLYLPNMLTVGRFAAVHYFRNQFAGITAVINHSHLGQSDNRMMENIKWRARLFYGIRF